MMQRMTRSPESQYLHIFDLKCLISVRPKLTEMIHSGL